MHVVTSSHPLTREVVVLPRAAVGERPHIGEAYVSPSQLASFANCPYGYYLKYRAGIPERGSSAPAFGSALHADQETFVASTATAAFADRVEQARSLAHRSLTDYLAANADEMAWNRRWSNGRHDESETLHDDIDRGIDALAAGPWQRFFPVAAEQGFLLRWRDDRGDLLPVLTFADLIEHRIDSLSIRDLTTGVRAKSTLDVVLDPALTAQALAVEIVTGEVVSDVGYYNWVRQKTPKLVEVEAPRTLAHVERLQLRVRAFTSALHADAFAPIDSTMSCKYCAHLERCHPYLRGDEEEALAL
jgi:hypothetical protein